MSAESTPLEVIACVSRVVTKVADRVTGDRNDYPLLVANACVEALKEFKIESRIMYGPVAWVEVLEDSSVIWAGCWGENQHFWVATQYGEIIDLNLSVAHRRRPSNSELPKALYSPPMLWSREVPKFYRCQPEGVAELELHDDRDRRWNEMVLAEVRTHCKIDGKEPEFPNEPILCPGRKLLDDSRDTFRHFDRIVSVKGIPELPSGVFK